MKIFTLTLLSLLMSSSIVLAQKESKADKKAKKDAEHEANMILTGKILNNQTYVVELNTLINNQGVTVPVTSNINFLMINEKEAVIQLGSASGPGFNGVGGVTVDGEVTDHQVKERKNNFQTRIDIFGAGITSNVFMDTMADGYCVVTIRTLQGQRIEGRGVLKSLSDSKVFKGRSSN